LLVDAGLLSQSQLESALDEQRLQGGGGKRLGQLIVSLGYVTEGQLARVLSQQLAVPWVSLVHIDFSPALLALVDRELAERYTVIPVYVRRERRDVDTLFLAMDDPTQDDVLRVVSERTKMPVRPMIAPPSDIRTAIARAYGPGTDFDDEPVSSAFPLPLVHKQSPKRELDPTPAAPSPRPELPASVPPPASPSTPPSAPRASPSLPTLTPDQPISRPQPPAPPPRPSQPALAAPAAPADAPPAQRHSAPPSEPAKTDPVPEKPESLDSAPTKPKTIALTLLDGTTIQIPAGRNRARTRRALTGDNAPKPMDAEVAPQARSILKALELATAGLSAEARAQRWEAVVHALITVLVAKGTVTEREIAEALAKIGR
jgi:type IV pilus assembly protein PilB